MSALRLAQRCLNTGKYSFLNYEKIFAAKQTRNICFSRQKFQQKQTNDNVNSGSGESSSRTWLGVAVLSGSLLVVYKTGLIDRFLPEGWRSQHVPPELTPREPVVKVKPLIVHLPDTIPYLIVGGGTAAFSAFRSIRAIDPKSKVIVISDEEHYPYMRPPLSKELWFSDSELSKRLKFRQWNGRERNIYFEHEEFYCSLEDLVKPETTGGVSIVRDHRVVKIDPVEQKAYLDNGQIIGYEKCLVASGGVPKNLEVFEKGPHELKKHVILYRKVSDFLHLEELTGKAKSITIIGGGFLGSELSCALARRAFVEKSGLVVNQVYPEIGNMARVLPEYLSKWTTDRVKEEGVNIIPNAEVKNAVLDGHRVKLTLNNGKEITTDYVVVAVGLQPNIELAKSAGLEIDEEHGGYRVNAELEARSNLWIAGDAACFYDVKLGRRRVEHHDHAVISGRLAGENMTGAKKPYWHQSMFWSDLGPNVGYEAIGLVDSSLPTVAVFAKQTPKDTPKAVVEENDESIRSEIKEKVAATETKTHETSEKSKLEPRAPENSDEYGKGVIFYLRENVVVGILLWNVFNRMSIARRVLNEMKSYEDLNEVAKLFHLHALEEDDQ